MQIHHRHPTTVLGGNNRRIGAVAVVVAFNLTCPQVHPDGPEQGRVPVVLEIRIKQRREFA